MKKVVLAYSGGLDTSYCIKFLSEKGFEVEALTINTGGFSKKEILELKNKAIHLGAKKFKLIDAVNTFYLKIIKFLIFGNVLKNNTYPLSVSAERIVQALEIVNYVKTAKANYVAHGSTGAGNDQVRFDLIFQILAPKINIITPIRDNKISRKDEVEFLKSKGIKINWEKSQYSINKGIWGTSIGGKETLTSNQALPEKAYPSKLKDERSKKINIEFYKGELISINGKKDSPINIIKSLQKISERFAIGRDIHVGDTIVGIKGRVAFEAAAPIIIIKAHQLLEKHTLTKWQQFQKVQLSDFYGMLLHEGQYLDPVMRNIESYLKNSQKNVSGKVFITLNPYRFELEGVESKNDLMYNSHGTYGETNKGWSADDAKGFIKITSNPIKIYNQKIEKK
tara:strand:+ start:521 stop:1705 length:1185 start_codon:yes stop_codon:yes gene_type:complete